jgi:hypothetical protein
MATRKRVLNQFVKMKKDYKSFKKDDICYVYDKYWDSEYHLMMIIGSKDFGYTCSIFRKYFDVLDDQSLDDYEFEYRSPYGKFKKGTVCKIMGVASSNIVKVKIITPVSDYSDFPATARVPVSKLKIIEHEKMEEDSGYLCAKMPWEI